MRNLKKFLALVLATMMLLSVAVISTNAAETNADYVEAAQRLAALQVMKGNENGDLMLENGVTRYQAALFFVQALTGETDVAVWNAEKKSASFSDVPEYGTAIDYANGIGVVKGLGNGTFGYNNAITYQDMLVMAVRALGYETEDMSYPYGYILAAQKLGLTNKVDLVNYKAALTRGETARIIWDMLNTQVAVIDPLTEKVYYPEANQKTVNINNTPVTGYFTTDTLKNELKRQTLFVDSGLAGDVITVTVEKFVAGDADKETVDTLEVTYGNTTYTLNAADFGITAETPSIAYKGLDAELYISVDAAEFDQTKYDDGKAEIVFVTFPEYTTVQNLTADGDIKYVVDTTDVTKSYLSIAGNKYKVGEYDIVTYTFSQNVNAPKWQFAGKTTYRPAYTDAQGVQQPAVYTNNNGSVAKIFEYNAKAANGVVYVNGGNTYGEVSYRVIESGTTGVPGTVEVLYTPYQFGQYNVREINGVKYTVVGEYAANNTTYVNMDDVSTKFVETLVGSNKTVDKNTKTLTTKQGEKASTVVVEGVAVEAGEFMFYNYNSIDNILTVAKNCGKFETGRLTAQSAKAETVKINGTNYEFGFAGNTAGVVTFNTAYTQYNVQNDYISKLVAGKDNVKFLAVDGKVVYMEQYQVNADDSVFPFAIINLGSALAELLDLDTTVTAPATTSEFQDALTSGLYVEDGVVKVAMLNLTTGEWELASVGTLAYNWDDTDKKFKNNADVAAAADYNNLLSGGNATYAATVNNFKALDNTVVAVVDVKDGVYTLAADYATYSATVNPTGKSFFAKTSGTGLNFYDNSALTNSICVDSKDPTVKARLELDAETVVVAIANGVVGARVGVQPAKSSLGFAGKFYSTTSDLIVYVADNAEPLFNMNTWVGLSADVKDNFYLSTLDTVVEVEVGATEDDPYTITITNLFDMKTMTMVEALEVEAKDITTADNQALIGLTAANKLIHKNASGEVKLAAASVTLADALKLMNSTKNATFKKVTVNSFEDLNTISITDLEAATNDNITITDGRAVTVDATVVTLNMVEVTDKNEYDLAAVISSRNFTNADIGTYDDVLVKIDNNDGNPNNDMVEKCAYELDLELVNKLTAPEAGVIDNTIINLAANTILAPNVEADADDYTGALEIDVTLTAVANYDADTDVVTVVIYKVLTKTPAAPAPTPAQ